MRYRTLSPAGDFTFGHGRADYLVDSPDAVAQAILTRLKLMTGEWFLDITEGTPYSTGILGTGTKPTYDAAIRDRILGTEGVLSIDSYSSSLSGRVLSVSCTVSTINGGATVTTLLQVLPGIQITDAVGNPLVDGDDNLITA